MAFRFNIQTRTAVYKNLAQLDELASQIPPDENTVAIEGIKLPMFYTSSDDKHLVAGEGDRTIKHYDQLINVFQRLPEHVTHISFVNEECFTRFSQTNFMYALKHLPHHIREISFDLTDIASMQYHETTLPSTSSKCHKGFEEIKSHICQLALSLHYITTANLIYRADNKQLELNEGQVNALKKCFEEFMGSSCKALTAEPILRHSLPPVLCDVVSQYISGSTGAALRAQGIFAPPPRAEAAATDPSLDDLGGMCAIL